MAPPRFRLILLVFSALLGLWLCPGQAYKLQGSCETESAACLDVDQDDTGLIQSPLRKTVEVKKVQGIVGSAAGQEGGATAPSLLTPPKDAPASLIGATASTQPHAPAAGTAPGAAAIHGTTAASAPAVAVVQHAAAVAPAATVGAVHKSEASASAQQVQALDNAAEMGLSFFQVDQEKGSDGSGQESHDFDFDDFIDDGVFPDPVAEGSQAPVGDATSTADKAATADAPGWSWTAMETSHASLRAAQIGQVLLLFVAIALLVNAMLRWHASGSRPRDALSASMRKKLESMPVASGLEVRSFCAIDGGGGTSSDKVLIPGMLMRIQGRVVNKCTAPLVAPLSGRSCVLYSASVSQHRHDGVHEPPVAFASAARDFTVQLEDCPEMFLEINSQDVLPFDMEAGRYACELPFGDAPDSWRGFMLDNLTPGVEGCGAKGQLMNRVDLGAKGPLNFRECSLVVGSRVTCIGEVVREHNGKLRLSPWSPSPPRDASGEPTKSIKRVWLTPEADPWLHKLMISDDSRLIVEASQLPKPGKCRSCTGNL